MGKDVHNRFPVNNLTADNPRDIWASIILPFVQQPCEEAFYESLPSLPHGWIRRLAAQSLCGWIRRLAAQSLCGWIRRLAAQSLCGWIRRLAVHQKCPSLPVLLAPPL